MKKEYIDFDKGKLKIPREISKTGYQDEELPITPELEIMLRNLLDIGSDPTKKVEHEDEARQLPAQPVCFALTPELPPSESALWALSVLLSSLSYAQSISSSSARRACRLVFTPAPAPAPPAPVPAPPRARFRRF